MPVANYEVEYDDFIRLANKLSRIASRSESIVNEYLHVDGAKIVEEELTKLLPMSRSRGRLRNKPHAKTSKWYKVEKFNLGFVVKSKGGSANRRGSFGYLIFPNEGRGSHNPLEQRFVEKSLVKSVPKVMRGLERKIDHILEEL